MHKHILAIALAALCLAAPALADGPVETPVRDLSVLDDSTQKERDWLANDKRGGFIVAGSQFLNVGKLFTKGPGERREACSGVLVSPDKYLTAAHCVCPKEFSATKVGNETYAQSCRRHMNELNFSIVFPGIGFVSADSNATIRDDYVPVHLGITAGTTKNADLALLHLKAKLDVPWSPVGSVDEVGLRFTVGFGLHSFKIVPPASGYIADNTYDDGPKQIAKFLDRKFYASPDECGDGAGLDTVCGEYSPNPLQGVGADASACNGDSGAPLFVRSGDGRAPHLIGITSYVYPPPKSASPCAAAKASMTYFVDLRLYADWLRQQIGNNPEPAKSKAACRSAILIGPGALKLDIPRGSVTAVTYDLFNPGEPDQRPVTEVQRNDHLKCEENHAAGYLACDVSEKTTLSLTLGPSPVEGINPLTQLVVCQKDS